MRVKVTVAATPIGPDCCQNVALRLYSYYGIHALFSGQRRQIDSPNENLAFRGDISIFSFEYHWMM